MSDECYQTAADDVAEVWWPLPVQPTAVLHISRPPWSLTCAPLPLWLNSPPWLSLLSLLLRAATREGRATWRPGRPGWSRPRQAFFRHDAGQQEGVVHLQQTRQPEFIGPRP